MGVTLAMQTLTEELVESHARCHYPYVVTSGPCSIEGAAGVYIVIDSEVYGRIASASATTWSNALIVLCEELVRTRGRRWAAESIRKV